MTSDPKPAATESSVVLVADDNEQNLELLIAYLDGMPNIRVVTARDGAETMAKIRSERPDLVLLDIMMPKMSGFQVCREVKNDPQLKSIPIVMVTALNEMGDIERGVECGTDDFLSKPINRLELVTRVKSLLRVKHLKNELERTLAYLDEPDAEEKN